MAEEKKNYVNFNGIDNAFVHERTRQDGSKFFSVGITPVPSDFSRNGIVNITTNYATPTKNDPNKFNVGFPEDFKPGISICTYADKENPKNNKYLNLTPNKNDADAVAKAQAFLDKFRDGKYKDGLTAKDINALQIEARKAIKDARATEDKAVEPAAVEEEEEEGMDR